MILTSTVLMISINVSIVRAQVPPWARRDVRASYISIFASHKRTAKEYESQVSHGFDTLVIQSVKGFALRSLEQYSYRPTNVASTLTLIFKSPLIMFIKL